MSTQTAGSASSPHRETGAVDLFTIGEALAVFLPADGHRLAGSRAYRRTVAGSEMNVAVALARQGLRARFVTTVGDDGLGDAVVDDLTREGVDLVVNRSSKATGVLVRDLASGADARAVNLRIDSAATDISADDVDRAWPIMARAVFVTGITAVRSARGAEAVRCTVQLARKSGALVVVDPNIRPRLATLETFAAALAPLRGLVDVAIGDAEELAALSGAAPELAAARLIEQGCSLVVTKLGADGVIATDGRQEMRVRSTARSVIDTVGAGDAFAAGLIAGLLVGATLHDALERGAFIAGRVVESEGDIEGLPAIDDGKEQGIGQ